MITAIVTARSPELRPRPAASAGTSTYDADGSLVSDTGRGISSVTWNEIGLPKTVSFSNGSSVSYLYAADGTKLREIRTVSGTSTTLDWCGDVVLEQVGSGTKIAKRLRTEEGYVDLTVGTGATARRYFVRDHLGSVRAVVDGSGTVLETDDYYPLGGPLPTGTSTTLQPEKYQGKEWNPTASFNVYDFGARLYDPALGRWLSQDPLAEKYNAHSPYLFCAGNPMRFVDPKGTEIRVIIGEGKNRTQLQYKEEKLYYMNGKEYQGQDSFALKILTTLNRLHSIKDTDIQNVLNALESSARKHYIEYYPYSDREDHVTPIGEFGYSLANSGQRVDTHILLRLNGRSIENGLRTTDETTLGHELKHAYDFDKGAYKGILPWEKHSEVNPAEISAVVFENRVRAALRLPKRLSYGKPISSSLLLHPPIY